MDLLNAWLPGSVLRIGKISLDAYRAVFHRGRWFLSWPA